jgi:AraC-like DNA-binding protein
LCKNGCLLEPSRLSGHQATFSMMEWSHIHSRPDLSGVEVLHAHFLKHRYPKHAHEHAVIGLVESGAVSLGYQGARRQIGPNGIFFVNPEEPHDGVIGDPSDPRGYTYRALYPTPEFLTNIVGEDHLRQLHFRDAVVNEPFLSDKLRCAHRAIEQHDSLIVCEGLLFYAIMCLLRHNGLAGAPNARMPKARFAVRRVCDCIEAHPNGKTSLAEYAALAGMSPFHLAHVFVREVGMPLHVYAETIRTRRAKSLLKGDLAISQIALQLGYADQSHFTRRFKQFQGVTPGQYRDSARLYNA